MHLTKMLATLKYTNHLMLPLVGINWFTVQQWLKEIWIYPDLKYLVLETTVYVPLLRTGKYIAKGGRHLYKIPIPPRFHPDVQRFIDGKYSQFSDQARRLITDLSGLPFDVEGPESSLKYRHCLLVAIDSSEAMKPWWDSMRTALSLEIFGDEHSLDTDELLSPPAAREEVLFNGELP